MRMRLILFVLAAFLCLSPGTAGAEVRFPLTVKDALGRKVTVPAEPKAILLGSGFNLVALSLIHPDPVSLLAGWSDDMKNDNPEIYARFRDKFPKIAQVPIIGDGNTVSLETVLSLKADLAIFSNWQADIELGRQAIAHLEQAGVPVIVVDFSSDVLKNTADNMRLLGRVLDREDRANAFADFYDARVERIRARVAAHPEPGPTVLMQAFPNPDRCCYAFGGGGLGEFIAITGSRNVADKLPRPGAFVSNEFIVASDPDVYIATASPGGTYSSFSVGPGVDPGEARTTLANAVRDPFLARLKAVRDGRVHGLWNFFNAVPLNILAAEAFARWLRPDLFADIDPADTMKEINERFAAVPFDGAYWISLREK